MIVGSLLLILVAVGLLVTGVLSGSNALIVCTIVVVAVAAIVLVIGVRQSSAASGSFDDDDDDVEDRELTGEYPAVSDNGFRVRQSDRRRRAGAASDLGDARDLMEDGASVGATSRRASRSAASAVADTDAGLMGATTDHGQMIVDPQADRAIPGQGMVGDRYADDTQTFEPGYPSPAYETQLIGAVTDDDLMDDDDADDEDPPDEPSAQMVSPALAARVAMLATEVLVVDGRPRYHVSGCVHLLSRETEPLPVGEAVELGFTPCGLCEPDSALLADARRV